MPTRIRFNPNQYRGHLFAPQVRRGAQDKSRERVLDVSRSANHAHGCSKTSQVPIEGALGNSHRVHGWSIRGESFSWQSIRCIVCKSAPFRSSRPVNISPAIMNRSWDWGLFWWCGSSSHQSPLFPWGREFRRYTNGRDIAALTGRAIYQVLSTTSQNT